VLLCNLSGDRQSEAGAAGFARPHFVSPPEALEDVSLVVWSYASTRIRDRNDHVSRVPAALYGDSATAGREFDCVVHQDPDQPSQAVLVCPDRKRIRIDVKLDIDIFVGSHHSRLLGDVAKERLGIDSQHRGCLLAGVAPCQPQKVIDQRRGSLRLPLDLLHTGQQLVPAPLSTERVLSGGGDQRQRRPQFVGRIRRELPDPRKRLLDSVEHRVQRFGQLLQLVSRVRHGQSCRQVLLGDGAGIVGNPGDRCEGATAKPQAAEDCERQDDRR
jgi:hypothetical protein